MNDQPTRINDILDEKSEKLKKPEEVITEVVTEIVGEAPKKNGGARPGAGMPKGYVTKKKRTALEAKNRFIERVHQHVDELFDAQLELAKGEKVVMVKIKERDDEGKVKKIYHEIVTDPETIKQVIDNEYGSSDMWESVDDQDRYHYVVTKPANNQAIEGMLNRAYGKAPEKVEIEGGFFKAETLNIQIINPPAIEEPKEVIDVDDSDSGTSDSQA